ncbi:hypothetical protein BOTBODRAFT_32776 [Botryobasidium botryosum FD-172 SS1]|uniref:Uncharacterized protein n=1 Tax=Botryobasidium botryosum (strain FD-172 SS1) TaxID=930990 RepID=A0A067MF08_BOTB1|nr:hypothetical protein BOTBODRAFT_32776 [Botryobasidium botryosum FD-172 SS1]
MATVILSSPRNRAHVADYARAVNVYLTNTGLSRCIMQLSVRIPIYVPSEPVAQSGTVSSPRQGAPTRSAAPPLGQSAQPTPTELDLIVT